MSAQEVLNELKEKRLPTYGTAQERRDRLKKQYGITVTGNKSGPSLQRRATTTDKIDQIKLNRDARRMKMEEARKLKSEREAHNEINGIKVDVDFQVMVENERKRLPAGR